MEIYLQVFINFKQNNRIRLLLITEFAYNTTKNTSICYLLLELNCKYYSYIFYKKDLDPCSKSKIVEELSFKLQELITVYQQNIYYAQEL